MVLDHVAQGAGAIVVAATVADAQAFRNRDLHVVDVTTVPDRLHDAVGEAEDEDVLDGLLAQVMVDAVNVVFAEDRVDDAVQLAGRGQVDAERLLDNHTRPAVTRGALSPGTAQLFDDVDERCRWHGQIVEAVAAYAPLRFDFSQLLVQAVVAFRVVVATVGVEEARGERVPDLRVKRAPRVLFDVFACLFAEGVV